MGQVEQLGSLGQFWLAVSSVPQFFTCCTIHKDWHCCAPQILGREDLNTNAFHKSETLGRNPSYIQPSEKLKQNLLFYCLSCWLSACQNSSCWFHCLPEDRKQSWQMPARQAALKLSFAFSPWKIGICCQTWNFSWQNFSYAKIGFRQDIL